MEVKPDDLVYSFLKAASGQKVAALVIYGFIDADGKAVTRTHSNSSGAAAGASMLIKMLVKADEGAIEVAAKAAYEQMKPLPMPWATLSKELKQKFLDGVATAFAAAQAHVAGKPSVVVS